MARERELKIVIEDPLAGVSSLGGGALGSPTTRHIEDVYHDAPDLRLARAGITLRWREGDGWTVKLPAGRVGGGLDRHELVVGGDAGWVPDAARHLIAAHLRSAELVPVATFSTQRTARPLTIDDVVVAEVTDDDVRADTFDRRRVRFREIEIELAPSAPDDLLDDIAGALPRSLTDRSGPAMPKLVRALGERAQSAADVEPLATAADASVGDAIAASLSTSVRNLLDTVALVRLDDGPRPVHKLRVATRRLRADLRTFADVLDPAWSEPLRAELGWLAKELGRVRDLDVSVGLVDAALDRHPDLAEAFAEEATAAIEAERDGARRSLLVHLVDGRAVELYDRLVDAAAAPPVTVEAPAAEVLPGLVRRNWKALRRSIDRFDALVDAPIHERAAALHDVRLRAKRVRYATNTVRAGLRGQRGRAAKRFARAAEAMQTDLGELHDAFVMTEWLEVTAAGWPPTAAFAAGRLTERLRAETAAAVDTDGGWRDAYRSMRTDRWWLEGDEP